MQAGTARYPLYPSGNNPDHAEACRVPIHRRLPPTRTVEDFRLDTAVTDPDRDPGSDPAGESDVDSDPAPGAPLDPTEPSEDVPQEELVRQLHEHLAATAEIPVERSASRLLGEAEAVAEDLRECPPQLRTERAAVVLRLLEEVGETGSPEADERVDTARRLAERLSN